jgi:hypothetical protein
VARSYVKVNELITWASNGDLRLPEIQRRYVWPATRVRDLLDSLYRGYPSGSILVWETNQDIETRRLSVEVAGSQTSFAIKKILLDGQQRITSLTSVIKGQPVYVRHRKKPIEILFNLEHPDESSKIEIIEVEEDQSILEEFDESEEPNDDFGIQEQLGRLIFVVASSSLKNNPNWVAVSDIFAKTDREILKPLGISSDDDRWDKYAKRLNDVRKIKDYEYVVEVLPQDLSYQEVAQIFVRVNSKGMKLRGHDLALAQISAKWKGFLDVIETFAKQFNSEYDYLIETGIIIRTMVAFATGQSRFDTIGTYPKESLMAALEDAKKGLRYSIDFLKNNASVGNLDNLGSAFLVIPIAVYSVLQDEKLSSDEERQLLKWFYLAHMVGHYSHGSTESILDSDLSILFKKKSLPDLIQALRTNTKSFNVDASDIAYKNRTSPFFSMLYFILRQEGVKDWQTGLLISENATGRSHAIQFDHIFPRALLKGEKLEAKEINEIANLAFVSGRTNVRKSSKLPYEYFRNEIVPKRGIADLQSQLIPTDETLWDISNYKRFLEYRRNAIAELINNFMVKFEGKGQDLIDPLANDSMPYGTLRRLEDRLRVLIESKLSEVSANWWIERIPTDVRQNAETKKQRSENTWPWTSQSGESLMSYLDFNDYLKIIRKGDNWKQVFKPIFVDEEIVSAKLRELDPIRNAVAHSRRIDAKEISRLRLLSDDLIQTIENAMNGR